MAIEIKRILLPTDISHYSAAAAKYACEFATKFDAELHVLHAQHGQGPSVARLREHGATPT